MCMPCKLSMEPQFFFVIIKIEKLNRKLFKEFSNKILIKCFYEKNFDFFLLK